MLFAEPQTEPRWSSNRNCCALARPFFFGTLHIPENASSAMPRSKQSRPTLFVDRIVLNYAGHPSENPFDLSFDLSMMTVYGAGSSH